MSLEATRLAWRLKLKSSQKLVILSLADRADSNNFCFPSISRLTEDTCLNRKTVLDAVKHLEIIGLITIEKGLGKGNKYTLILENPVPKRTLVPKTVRVPKTAPVPVPKTVPPSPKNGTTTSPENGTLIYQSNLSTNLPVESNIYKKLDFTCWPSFPDKQILDDWFKMRKRLKADVTQTVVNRMGKQLTLCVDAGYLIDDCIGEAVERNWKGFKLGWMQNATKPNKPQPQDKGDDIMAWVHGDKKKEKIIN
ncbi:MAG: helix-turn-helix domain-containing protein [Gammaproteobacteria bacterium]|nr:helix-turn-helix domain-containing protein [Gammaproteobacteria bacterium]